MNGAVLAGLHKRLGQLRRKHQHAGDGSSRPDSLVDNQPTAPETPLGGVRVPESQSRDDRIAALRECKAELDGLITAELEGLRPRRNRHISEERRGQLQELLEFAEPQSVTHLMARVLENHGLSLRSGLSFKAKMLEHSEGYQLGVLRPAWLLDNKVNAYTFVDALDVTRPEGDRRSHRLADIKPSSPVLLKPVKSTGARGVYAVYAPDRIRHVQDGKEMASWDEMLEHAGWLMSPKHPRPVRDRWVREDLILEDAATQRSARDVKFFAFYGETLLIRESVRGPGGRQRVRFWTSAGQHTSTGHDKDDVLTDAVGATEDELHTVANISRQIPAPFMRIDMLRGESGLVFGEFTPRPGQFEQFNDKWDRAFGEAWVRAEGRIMEDVLAGKDFSTLANATRKRSNPDAS